LKRKSDVGVAAASVANATMQHSENRRSSRAVNRESIQESMAGRGAALHVIL
jgi:hypothetical protein